MTRDDGRLNDAKAIQILEVASRLGIEGLRPAGHERVGPCPVCDGRSARKPFPNRFAINPDKGVFICRQCDAGGDGLALVQHVQGCDFKAALAFLVGDAAAQIDPAELARRRAKAEAAEKRRQNIAAEKRARAIRDAREIWHRSKSGAGSPAEAYLAGRGIYFKEWPPTLRFLPDHPYLKSIGGRMQVLHSGPCMIAGIQGPGGRVTGVHQTWINTAAPGKKAVITAPDGEVLSSKMVRGSKKGGAIRLTGPNKSGILVAGEGIETTGSALTVGAIPAAAYWVLVDLGNMSGRQLKVPGVRNSGKPDLTDLDAWVPPAGIIRLLFIQDGDSAPKPTRAKLEAGLLRAQALRPGLQGLIVHPGDGVDMNDLLQEDEGENPDGC